MTKILVYLLVVGMEVFGNKVPNLDKYLSYININSVFKKYVELLDKHLLNHSLFNSFFGFLTTFFITAIGLGIVNIILYTFLNDIGSGLFVLGVLLALFVSYSEDSQLNHFVAIHERIFGIIFWFIFLGWFGGLLYWFTIAIHKEIKGTGKHAAFVGACEKSHMVLSWIPARITGLIYALAGNFASVTKPWLAGLTDLTKSGHAVLEECGNAATEGKPVPGQKKGSGETAGGIGKDALIQRAVIIWCVVGIIFAIIF